MSRFAIASRLERQYFLRINKLVEQINGLIGTIIQSDMSLSEIQQAESRLSFILQDYSQMIKPWASNVSKSMVEKIANIDETNWMQLGRTMGRELRKEINTEASGRLMRQMMEEQVSLITSLPLSAAQRVHDMTLEAIVTGERAENLVQRIFETGHVTQSRARLIARTEVARTASLLTQARSEDIGVTHYYWRTCEDSDVRESHKDMNGKIVAWNKPPIVDKGKPPYHAGQIYNCRCYPEPIIDLKKLNW